MGTNHIQNGETEPIEPLILDAAGDPVTGLSNVLLAIRRISDGYYLDFYDNTFKASGWTTRQIVMIELDAVNDAGVYYYGFDTSGFDDDTYQMRVECASGANTPQTGELKVGGYVSQLLAMGGRNVILKDTVYDADGNLTSGTLLGYANEADLKAEQNHVLELDISGVYVGPNKVTTFIRKDSI